MEVQERVDGGGSGLSRSVGGGDKRGGSTEERGGEPSVGEVRDGKRDGSNGGGGGGR